MELRRLKNGLRDGGDRSRVELQYQSKWVRGYDTFARSIGVASIAGVFRPLSWCSDRYHASIGLRVLRHGARVCASFI